MSKRGKHGEIESASIERGNVVRIVYWWASDPPPVEGYPVRRYTSFFEAGNSLAAEHLVELLNQQLPKGGRS